MGEVSLIGARPVLTITAWPTNAHMVEDCVKLGYLRSEWDILDPTYGRGKWWTRWRPAALVVHSPSVDFRSLKYAAGSFDAAVFDPPYVAKGGRRTSGIADFDDRYGLADAPRTPQSVQQLLNAGLSELARVVRPGGFILVKCMDYISSGKLWLGTYETLKHGLGLGLLVQDRMEHMSGTGPQPGGRVQRHAWHNGSTLLVFQVPKG